MANCTPASTPIDTKPKLSTASGDPFHDTSFYRSIGGALQYLTLTRPDITYAVNQVCLHMHTHKDSHWNLIKRVLQLIMGFSSLQVLIWTLLLTPTRIGQDARIPEDQLQDTTSSLATL